MISTMAPPTALGRGQARKALFILNELLDDDVEWLAHAGDRLQLVEHVHGLHRHRQPDAGGHALLQTGAAGRFATHNPAVVDV